ncbi:hypothetical protein C7S15_6172 [Burkholderia cepacia]|nr:hypothetical protein [Burkholderia cepacia]
MAGTRAVAATRAGTTAGRARDRRSRYANPTPGPASDLDGGRGGKLMSP